MTRRRKYQRMEFHAPRHPSGRPIERNRFVELPFKRHVHDEPMVPGLRPGCGRTEAIGFGLDFRDEDDE